MECPCAVGRRSALDSVSQQQTNARPTVRYFGDFCQCIRFLTYFLLVGKKRGDGFYVGFQKMDYVYFYGSSVRMGHKVYIIPILLS